MDRIARLLGVRITVKSRVGHGSCFGIALPLGSLPDAAAESPAVPPMLETGLAGRFVAVVDNDAQVLEATATLLGTWGCRLVASASAEGVLAALSLVVDARRSPAAVTFADLKGATVGVQDDTTDCDAAVALPRTGQIGAIRAYPFARITDAMADLAAGGIAAVMKVYPIAAWLARPTPGLRILAQVPNDPQPLGIGFNRRSRSLLGAVDRVLLRCSETDATLLPQDAGTCRRTAKPLRRVTSALAGGRRTVLLRYSAFEAGHGAIPHPHCGGYVFR